MVHSTPVGRVVASLVAALLALVALSFQWGSVATQRWHVKPIPDVVGHMSRATLTAPLSTSQCVAQLGIHCYKPFQLRLAYDLAPLHNRGFDGRGRTIVLVDSFGSPTIQNDLHVFDQEFGLPDPPSLTIRQDAGPVPAFDPNNSDMVGWAEESTLDVEWTHVIAPGASIVLEETPVSETEGVQGFPEIVRAENFLIDHHIGDVISQSFGATENTFPSRDSLLDLRGAFFNAFRHHVTVLGSSGDAGATDYQLNLQDLYTSPVNSWPSSDPLVTSIGGTMLTLDDNGVRQQPDVVWNDLNTVGGGAGGGGKSQVFDRPPFQNQVRGVVGGARGTPDISMSAAVDGAVWYYWTFVPARAGYHLVAGTSEASPLFAGIVAIADQIAGRPLGYLNGRLYHLGQDPARKGNGIVDVTVGNNTFGPFTNTDGNTYTVQGYPALPGYDMASGWGTVDAARFVPDLAREGDDL